MPAAAPAAKAAKATEADATTPVPARRRWNRKRLLIVAALALLVLIGGAAAAAMIVKQRAQQSEEGGEADAAAPAEPTHERRGPPTFAPLDPFTVNLTDREAERYAQVGITLELEQPEDAETVKQYMPAIRHNILMALSQKTATELLGREGKQQLADEVRREALRALEHDDADGVAPVRAVQFSNFIIQ